MGKYMPWVLGGVGALLAFRTFYRPHRALIAEGFVSRCAGPKTDPSNPTYGYICDVTMTVVQGGPDGGGLDDVFSVVKGDVISVGPYWVHIQAINEPVVLYYGNILPSVEMGERVGRGQTIGQGEEIHFGVWELYPQGRIVALEPASWLASRGLRVASTLTEGGKWCSDGRKIAVPRDVHSRCPMELPKEAGFALLPVSVKEE